ncbi:MAG: 50S ribosomal protein L21 [Clostridiales bacterium]|nr:50S ribosomal protein L21 [Clostridiales bacterium]
MYAIIETGGKQYRVAEGDIVNVEKLDANVGDKVELNVMMLVNDGKTTMGNPYVADHKVVAEVVEQGKADKIVVFKYKAKKNYRRKQGHRQPYSALKILSVN